MHAYSPECWCQLPQTSMIKSKFRPMWINHMAKKRQSRGAAEQIAASAAASVLHKHLRELREGVKNVISRGDSGKGGAAGVMSITAASNCQVGPPQLCLAVQCAFDDPDHPFLALLCSLRPFDFRPASSRLPCAMRCRLAHRGRAFYL